MTMARPGIALEKQLVAGCIQDKTVLFRAARVLEDYTFESEELADIFGEAKRALSDFGELPSAGVMAKRFKERIKDKNRLRRTLQLLLEAYDADPSVGSTLKEMEDYVRYQAMRATLPKVIEHLQGYRVDEAYKLNQQLIRSHTYRHKEDIWITDFDGRMRLRQHMKDHPEDYAFIPTRIPSLDARIIGLQKGELGMLLGTTGIGKTIATINLGLPAAARGFYVVHFTTEMEAFKIAGRYDTKISHLPHEKFKRMEFTPEELELLQGSFRRRQTQLKDRLQIVGLHKVGAGIMDIEETLEERASRGIPTDLLIIDSPDHFSGTSKFREKRFEIADIYWSIASLAQERRVGIWTTSHLAKKWKGKIAPSEGAAESYDKARIASIVITINQTKEQAQAVPPAFDLWVDKVRDGPGGFLIPMVGRYEIMSLYEDKVRLEEMKEKEEVKF